MGKLSSKPLAEVCRVGCDKPSPFKGDRPYYSTGAVGVREFLSDSTPVTFDKRPSRANCMPPTGAVGFAKMKGTKKVLLITSDIEGSLFSTGFCFLLPGQEVVSEFLAYFVESDMFCNAKDQAAGDGIMGGVKDRDAQQLRLPLPPVPDQERIVAILDEAFAAIATATTNVEKNLANTRGLFESYLQTLITQRGQGWTEMQLSDISEVFGRGKSRHRPRNEPTLYGGPYPFIQTGDISRADHWLNQYSQTYSEIGLAQSRLWPRGTVCIALVGATVGETAILDFEACFPDSIIGIVVNKEMAGNEYVEYVLQAFKLHLKEKGKGTARDNINVGTFEGQRFPFPPLKQQKEIVATLNHLRENTQNIATICQQKLTFLAELKQSILQKAFTGELTGEPDKILTEAGL